METTVCINLWNNTDLTRAVVPNPVRKFFRSKICLKKVFAEFFGTVYTAPDTNYNCCSVCMGMDDSSKVDMEEIEASDESSSSSE